MNLNRALAISDYQCDERTRELAWLAEQAQSRKQIAEIGCWKGCTTRALADNTRGTVYAVDTFKGSVNEEAHQKLGEKPEGWLFMTFQKNTDDLKNLVVCPMRSVDAARYYEQLIGLGLLPKFDLIFLDASHDLDSVRADIRAWRPLLADGGLLCGHDRQWDGVAKAVKELLGEPSVGAGAIWYV